MKRVYPLILGLVAALVIGFGIVSAGGGSFLFQHNLGPVTIIITQFLQVSGQIDSAKPFVRRGELVSSGSFRVKNPTENFQSFSVALNPAQAGFELRIAIGEQPSPASPATVLPIQPPPPASIFVIAPGQEIFMEIKVFVRLDAEPISISSLILEMREEGLPTSPPPPPAPEPTSVPQQPPSTPSTSAPIRAQPVQGQPSGPPTYPKDSPVSTQPVSEVPRTPTWPVAR